MGQVKGQVKVQTFAGLMIFGDRIKICFFVRTGARVRNLPRWAPIALTGILASLYLVIFLSA